MTCLQGFFSVKQILFFGPFNVNFKGGSKITSDDKWLT